MTFKMYLIDDYRIKMTYKGITLPGHLTSRWLAERQGFYPLIETIQEDKDGKFVEMGLAEDKQYVYEFVVRYTTGGCMMSTQHPTESRSFYNPQEALYFATQEVMRLTKISVEMDDENSATGHIEINKICACCDGRGKFGQQKGKRVIKWVHKTCPVCKGKDSHTRVI